MATQSKVLRVRAECGEAWPGRARSLRAWSGREDSSIRVVETRLSKVLVAILVVAGANIGLLGVAAVPASAAVVFSQHPIAGWSTNGPVHAVKIVGDTVYVGGDFSQVRGPGGSPVVARTNLFAINRNTGAMIPGFVAYTNGIVRAHRLRRRERLRRRRLHHRQQHDPPLHRGARPGHRRACARSTRTRRARSTASRIRGNSSVPRWRLQRDRQHRRGAGSRSSTRRPACVDPTFNPAPDGAVRTFAFSPDGGRIYVGGDYPNIAGHRAAATSLRSTRSPARCIPVVFQQLPRPGARPRRRPDGSRVYAALGGTPGAGNRTDRLEREHRRAPVAQRSRR